MPSKSTIATVLAAATLLLTACSPLLPTFPRERERQPDPEPAQAAHVFDVEGAVNAADAALLEYWDAVETAYRSGGQELEALRRIATEPTVGEELAVAEHFAADGLTLLPDYTASATQFEQLVAVDGTLNLVVTTCVDSTGLQLIDREGREHPVTQTALRSINEITFEMDDHESFSDLKIARWSLYGDSPC